MRVLLAGGGTGGSVTPVLAVAQEIKKIKPKTEFLFVGTHRGPEKFLVEEFGIKFIAMPAAKLRRYFSIWNFFDVFVFIASFIWAFAIFIKFRPQIVFSAGGYVAVPLSWVGKLFGSKIAIHQQDLRIGLANKLIAPLADQITTAFEYTAKSFYSGSGLFTRKWKSRAEWVGNPYRQDLLSDLLPSKSLFGLHEALPILLVIGGARGAIQINQVVGSALPELVKLYQVIHQTGKGKRKSNFTHPDYHPYDFLPFQQYAAALRLADLVIARSGLSTITELAALGKLSIIVPMPESHQEDNAIVLMNTNSALVFDQKAFTPEHLIEVVRKIKFYPEEQNLLKSNIIQLMPKDASSKIAKIILKLGENRKNGKNSA